LWKKQKIFKICQYSLRGKTDTRNNIKEIYMEGPQGVSNPNAPGFLQDEIKAALRGLGDQVVERSAPLILGVGQAVIRETGRSAAKGTEATAGCLAAAYVSPELAPQLAETAEGVRRSAHDIAQQLDPKALRPVLEEVKAGAHVVTDVSVDATVEAGDDTSTFLGFK
jgi:hypothetical protein